MKSIKISTIYVWFFVQTILSIIFYLDDEFIDRWEGIYILLLSFPLTISVQWLRGEYKQEKTDLEDTNNQDI